ncbi:MAG: response regulator [Ferruginibacter sp.]
MTDSKRILLVDDDADDQLYFVDAIAEINPSIECKIVNNGLEALQELEILPAFDFIFLDLNMPIMNGFECLGSLKKVDQYKDIPVVIFTTSKNPYDIERTKELGADWFFTKPTNFSILCDKLKQIFEPGPVFPSFVV